MLGLVVVLAAGSAALGASEALGPASKTTPQLTSPTSAPAPYTVPAYTAPTTTTVPPGPSSPPAPGPLVTNAAAWIGHGDLAFVSRGQLEVLDQAGRLSTIVGPAAGGYDSDPSWSMDGQWLAFLHTGAFSGVDIPAPTLWLVAAGSTDARQVSPEGITMFAWSPVSEELAFAVAPPSTDGTVPAPGNQYLYLDRPDSGPVTLPIGTGSGVEDLAWSPDGQQIAFDDAEVATRATPTSPGTPPAGQLGVISPGGGNAAIVYRLQGSDIRLAAWWPQGEGLLFWEAPGFAEAADGLTLYSLGSGTTTPVPFLPSLVGPIWVAPEPRGDAVAVVAGMGRSIWSTGRDVELCTFPSAQCKPVNVPSDTESLAPSWTASGALLFSEASTGAPFGSAGNAYWSPGFMVLWEATNIEWGLTATGAQGRLASAPSATLLAAPSATGSSVLYVANDELWLGDTSSSAPAVMVAGPLYSSIAPNGYYGEVDWSASFAWSLAPVAPQLSARLIGEVLAPAGTVTP
jgi:dipeptidyl aminopeptidase/acylaminoacyl peptidase